MEGAVLTVTRTGCVKVWVRPLKVEREGKRKENVPVGGGVNGGGVGVKRRGTLRGVGRDLVDDL